jgi:hypothetical protein
MADNTTNLNLPFLMPAQAQKHVTVNEALLRLDALVQASVSSATTLAQPTAPVDGALYILPAGKTGAAWGAMANNALAYWRDGAWEQITPREGWIAYVKDSDQLRVFDGAAWTQAGVRTALGLGSAATRAASGGAAALAALDAANTWSAQQTITGNLVGLTFTSGGRIGDQTSPERTLIWAAGDRLSVITENGAAQIFDITPLGMTVTSAFHAVFHAGAANAPSSDNAFSLGNASFRFSTVFAATSTINTSDAREKTALSPIPDGVKRAVRRVIAQVGVFQWLESVERKGADRARKHVGVTAQAVRDAFAAEGEDPARWALFCEDAVMERVEVAPAKEEGEDNPQHPSRFEERPLLDAQGAPVTRLGVRADQLMWLAIAAIAA